MTTLTTTKPVSLTTVDATVLANNFTAIETVVNGGLDNSNINNGANISVVKLAPGTNGQVLTTAGGVPTWANTAYLYPAQKYTTLIDIVSSTTETDILQTAGFLVPAGTLGVSGTIRVTIQGGYKMNSANGTGMPRLRVKFGGTTLMDPGAAGSNAVTGTNLFFPFKVNVLLQNLGAANSQWASMEAFSYLPPSATGAVTGVGGTLSFPTSSANTQAAMFMTMSAASAIDTTVAKTLQVTAELQSNSAAHELKIYSSLIEFI